ncbi:hypothetical protein P4647_23415 [Peribacillus frigoritolerans]|uniref:hypothetical protein n=1 Tax=Peribacillus frigoritolerans TaxID=450367 RepID=UPI002E1EDD8E|nr:hypothetical protein [Peribacillus frigoritolerans]
MSKKCPICEQYWDDGYSVCPIDGVALTAKRKVITSPSSPQQDMTTNTVDPSKPASDDSSHAPIPAPKKRSSFSMTKWINKLKRKTAREDYIEGTVRNFHEDIVQMNFVSQWFLALLKGCPFVLDGNICNFELVDSSGQVNNVVMYGKIIRGRFQDHSTIKVFGKRDRHNTIIAKSVENLSSNSKVKVNKAVSNGIVRIISSMVFLLLFYLVFMVDYISLLISIKKWLLAVISALLPIVILLIFLWFCLKKLFK